MGTDAPWLLLIHQIPPRPHYLRVKTWRRLQRLGAVAIKNSVYVLPRTDAAYEDFQWLQREISAAGGEAAMCEAQFVEGLEDEHVVALFHTARDADYAQVTEESRALLDSLPTRIPAVARAAAEAALGRLRRRFAEIAAIDFFAAPGQQVADASLADVEARVRVDSGRPARSPKEEKMPTVHARTWVTRAGMHVDRIASSWLIRRFIDPKAEFKFVSGDGYRPQPGELRFDMFEAEFTHEGEHCTFEVLVERFGLDDPALRPIAAIVHDIDLKDAKHCRPETAGVDHLIAGLALAHKDDVARLERGAALFDDLYEYFKGQNPTGRGVESARP